MARLRLALAASAALGALAWMTPGNARADDPKAVIEGVEDEDLRERLARAVGETERPPQTRFQARRRAADAAQDVIAVLRSEGYYAHVVEPDVAEADPPTPVVRVTPGPRFRIFGPQVEWLDPPATSDAQTAAKAAMELAEGEPGRAADVIAAEGRIVAALSTRGYADAKAGERRVVVDHADSTVRPTYRIDSGDLVRLNGIELNTEGRTNRRWLQALAPWKVGEVYDPEDVAELERRLLDTNVYSTVTVALSPPSSTNAQGHRPVIVSLADRPRRTLEAGVGWSTSEGFGLDALVTWYNRFGRADTLQTELRLAQIESRLGVELQVPHWRRPARTLTLGAEIFNEDTPAYDRLGALLRADLRQRVGKTSFFTYGASLEASRNEELGFDPVTSERIPIQRELAILTGIAGLSLDRSDDPLDPRRGWRVNAEAQPTAIAGDDNVYFLRAQAQGTIYVPLQDEAKTVAAGRLRLGSVLGGSIPEVPTARRFFSGGGGSVRGYEYQGIGPRLPDGTPRGGLSLVESTLEVRHRFTERWGGVAFLEGGAVGEEQYPDFGDIRLAAGVGVRFHLPFGPVRADVAVPLNPDEGQPAFQVYISIGQAF